MGSHLLDLSSSCASFSPSKLSAPLPTDALLDLPQGEQMRRPHLQSALPVSPSADGAIHTVLQVGNLDVCLSLPSPCSSPVPVCPRLPYISPFISWTSDKVKTPCEASCLPHSLVWRHIPIPHRILASPTRPPGVKLFLTCPDPSSAPQPAHTLVLGHLPWSRLSQHPSTPPSSLSWFITTEWTVWLMNICLLTVS